MGYKKTLTLAPFPKVVQRTKEYVYIKEYRNMHTTDRRRKMALVASDNGRCWWIYEWLNKDYGGGGNG
jgi:hypothetical protein